MTMRKSEFRIEEITVENFGKNYIKIYTNGNVKLLVKDEFFKEVSPFKNGVGMVQRKNELYNFLDENGNYISSIDFVYASGFLDNDTSIIVTEKGEKNYLRKDGSFVSKENLGDELQCFENGIAAVKRQNNMYNFLLEEDGVMLFHDDFVSIISVFNNAGVAIVEVEPEEYNFIAYDGTYIFDDNFIGIVYDGKFTAVKSKTGFWNYVTSDGELVSNEWFLETYGVFSEFGITWVRRENGLFNLLTVNGNLVFSVDLEVRELKKESKAVFKSFMETMERLK